MLLVDKATFPRDKPCGGGMTMRAVRQCPVDPTPVVEELVDQVELRFRYGAAVVHQANEPVVWMTQRQRLDAFLLDAARERGAEVREGVKVSLEPDNTVVARDGREGARRGDRRRRRRERDHRAGRSGSATASRTASRTRETSPTRRCRASATPAGSCSSSPTSPAATRGSSRRATTRTSASAAGRARGRSCRSTCAAPARRTASSRTSLESLRGHRLPLRRPGTRIAGERALLVGDAAGPDRPGVGGRHVRVLRLVTARDRRDPRPARRPQLDARALRGGGRR